MNTIFFPFANRTVDRITNDRGNKKTEIVHYYFNGSSTVRCYRATLAERFRILFTGNIWLIARGSMPHISDITTESPFDLLKSAKGGQSQKKNGHK